MGFLCSKKSIERDVVKFAWARICSRIMIIIIINKLNKKRLLYNPIAVADRARTE